MPATTIGNNEAIQGFQMAGLAVEPVQKTITNLLAMASNLLAMASNLIAMASMSSMSNLRVIHLACRCPYSNRGLSCRSQLTKELGASVHLQGLCKAIGELAHVCLRGDLGDCSLAKLKARLCSW